MDRSDRHALEQRNVLLVDDDQGSARRHRNRLQALGYHVVDTSDPEAALVIAKQSAPRLIFLSIDRSGSGRTRFLQALRANDHTRHIPVAMLSSGHDRSMEHLGLQQVGRELW